MSLKTAMANVTRAKKAHDKALKALGKNIGKEIAVALAKAIPEGCAIEWSQYTPYFNDGEECVFSVNDPILFRIDDADEGINTRSEGDEGVVELYSVERYGKVDYLPLVDGISKKEAAAVKALFDTISEDVMRAAFGDHAVIRVTHDGGLESDALDHD